MNDAIDCGRRATRYAYVLRSRYGWYWCPIVEEQWAGEVDEGWAHRLVCVLSLDPCWEWVPQGMVAQAERIGAETIERFGPLPPNVVGAGREFDADAWHALRDRIEAALNAPLPRRDT